MADIRRIEGRNIVLLKVALQAAQGASEQLGLASPLTIRSGDPASYWYGPDCWYLVSESRSASDIIKDCSRDLSQVLHNAVDYSASLTTYRLSGTHAREILASGSGLDLRPDRFSVGKCSRTRLAGIAAMITATEYDTFEVFVDRSYAKYLDDWLHDTDAIVALAAES